MSINLFALTTEKFTSPILPLEIMGNNLIEQVIIRQWSGDWFYLCEYFKFSIHVFTTVKYQTMVAIFKHNSVLKVVVSIFILTKFEILANILQLGTILNQER